MRLTLSLAAVAGVIFCLTMLWQGCQMTQAAHRLPEHRYPTSATANWVQQVNPAAAATLTKAQAVHGTQDTPVEYVIPTHSHIEPVVDFVRATIARRGGATTLECVDFPPEDFHFCSLKAAVPADMTAELEILETVDFDNMQVWIGRQPTTADWEPGIALDLTTIKFRTKTVHIWPIRAPYDSITTAGYFIATLSSITLVAAAGAGGVIWLVSCRRSPTQQTPRSTAN